jgi:tetratricopeptide (TPR) repeat protein
MSRRAALARPLSVVLLLGLGACAPPAADAPAEAVELGEITPLPEGAEALSLLGDTLFPPELSEAVLENHTARYREAEEALAANPDDADALIWMGRRTAYLGQYRNAIDIYSHAISLHPDDARLYRHRGHRYVSIRALDHAIADFRRAVELTAGQPDQVEPDGLPNAMGVPTSTLQFNIWYHLGLAYYLKGDFEAAAEAYAACADVSEHPDSKVATAYWQVMTLKRLGRMEEAQAVLDGITPEMDVIESTEYLGMLLVHKGERAAEELLGPAGSDATQSSTTAGYGVGAWHLLQGDVEGAQEIFRRVITGRSQWAAFGFIAAEAELARAGRP